MLDLDRIFAELDGAGFAALQPVREIVEARLAPGVHGRMAEWMDVLETLADPLRDPARLRDLLLRLSPWRKGPFDVRGIHIDAEWRSDMKWARLENRISPLQGKRILDVGCGNGWYALRMREMGAKYVVGVDPTLNHIAQFEAVRRLTDADRISLLPLRLDDLPAGLRTFDTVFSMGVLYHCRDPWSHLVELRESLVPGGQLVLETLVLPGEHLETLEPESRYARMRNVWHLPTVPVLRDWLTGGGFGDIRLVDVTRTTIDEQRSTEWMAFESLAECLDPGDPTRTIEGHPAPTRAVLTAAAP